MRWAASSKKLLSDTNRTGAKSMPHKSSLIFKIAGVKSDGPLAETIVKIVVLVHLQ